ncbi:MAG: DoxX family protein [Psychroserpens sp.]|nr:DoxX family protein [Psychroserpens sp.]
MIQKIISAISAAILLFFGVMKLVGSEASRKGFAEFSPKIGLDPEFFMYFTGAIEVAVGALLILSIFELNRKVIIGIIAYLMLIGTMSGALFTEFVLREEAKIPLVIIAFALVLVSIYSLRNNLLKWRKDERV